jgi:hypothetical protein
MKLSVTKTSPLSYTVTEGDRELFVSGSLDEVLGEFYYVHTDLVVGEVCYRSGSLGKALDWAEDNVASLGQVRNETTIQ